MRAGNWFHFIMDDLLLSEVQIIEKLIVNKQENTLGLYCEVYFRKTKKNIKILVRKKKNTEPSVLRKIESNHSNVVTQEFLLAIFSQQRTALTFIQTKV